MTASSSSAPMVSLGRSFRGDKSSGRIAAHDAGEVPLQAHEVLIDIVASGLCGTDLHYRKASIGLGHEGVGVVSQVGGGVESFKKGDRVGWGYVHGADLTCDNCIRGVDTLCPNRKLFGASNTQQGSLGDHYVINAQFLHRIPDSLLLKHAAPLQCAGATVLSAIVNSGAQPWDRVGVVGLGGLGHLALQYLAKMGCDVVAFSGSDSKRDEALRLGAKEFVAAKDGGLEKLAKPVKYLFVSTSVQPDWDAYTSEKVMASRGTVVPLSVSPEPFRLKSYQSIISRELRIMGSVVASRPLHRQMIEFSARHGIQPIIEELPMTEEGVNEAADRLEKGDVRYRFVLINEKHADPLDKSSK